ncbi:hypothetical protein AAMO2058_001004000 [Amorphochlora amoebiformis]
MATGVATRSFLRRHVRIAERNIRNMGPLSLSSIGFGGYRIDPKSEVHFNALLKAIKSGINVIDTAPSYSDGGSERMIGAAIRHLELSGDAKREELLISTKVGYIEGSDLEAVKNNPPLGSFKISDDAWHCIHPDYIMRQIDESSERLGSVPDFVLLHSPEFFLSYGLPAGKYDTEEKIDKAYGLFYERIGKAFECLEKLVKEGRIGHYYGVSSSLRGCDFSVTGRENRFEAVSLKALLDTAKAAAHRAGTASSSGHQMLPHRMRIAQIPLNLVESGPAFPFVYDPEADEQITTGIAAEMNDIYLMTNRPFNAIPPEGIGAGDWGRHNSFFKLVDKTPTSPELAYLSHALHAALTGCQEKLVFDDEDVPTQEKMQVLALAITSAIQGVGTTLVGARTEEYVDDAIKVLNYPKMSEEIAIYAMHAFEVALATISPDYAKLKRSHQLDKVDEMMEQEMEQMEKEGYLQDDEEVVMDIYDPVTGEKLHPLPKADRNASNANGKAGPRN